MSNPFIASKLEEHIEKLERTRTYLEADLNNMQDIASPYAIVAIQNTISDVDRYIREARKELDDMAWYDFIAEAMGEDNGDQQSQRG